MGIRLGIAAVSNLRHALGGRAVELVLEDIDIARGFYHAVGASFRCCLLVVDRVAGAADKSHDEVDGILELPFVAFLSVAFPYRVGNTGQEIVQQTAEVVRPAMVQGLL